MRGDEESTRKTFAAKLVVSGKDPAWISGNRRTTGPSNIHAFGARQAPSCPVARSCSPLTWAIHAKIECIGDLRMVPKPRRGIGHRSGREALLHTPEQHFDNPEDFISIADAQRRRPEDLHMCCVATLLMKS